ncbi:hypothetical protein KPC_3419 [Acinetobacter stercoris]|uniref:Uncharacterized protein n=1 Tax=Acinetobacter stercoris TaxID=2126983 RepID=A0A2U3N3J3_9GAMM|nr:hypothetical protein KPC_3419 [Acinetobacter stercoris]
MLNVLIFFTRVLFVVLFSYSASIPALILFLNTYSFFTLSEYQSSILYSPLSNFVGYSFSIHSFL